jgi:hypothetical protein
MFCASSKCKYLGVKGLNKWLAPNNASCQLMELKPWGDAFHALISYQPHEPTAKVSVVVMYERH